MYKMDIKYFPICFLYVYTFVLVLHSQSCALDIKQHYQNEWTRQGRKGIGQGRRQEKRKRNVSQDSSTRRLVVSSWFTRRTSSMILSLIPSMTKGRPSLLWTYIYALKREVCTFYGSVVKHPNFHKNMHHINSYDRSERRFRTIYPNQM